MRKAAGLIKRLGSQHPHPVDLDRVTPGHVGQAAERLVGLAEDDAVFAAVGAGLLSSTHQRSPPVRSANILLTAVCMLVVRGNSGYHGASTQNASGALLGQLR